MDTKEFEQIVIKHLGEDFRATTIYGDRVDECLLELKEKFADDASSRLNRLVIKADSQACAAAEEISKTLTKQQLSFKEKLIISLAGNDKYVLMKEIDRDRVKGIVYKDFDYEETAKTIIKQAEKIIEIMEA